MTNFSFQTAAFFIGLVAGSIPLIYKKAREKNVKIFPIDSEHSAIWQCLAGNEGNPVSKIIITASGGPFRTLPREQIKTAKAADALRHPNWNMGRKITIDCATLMNKGLEIIEARYLFDFETMDD